MKRRGFLAAVAAIPAMLFGWQKTSAEVKAETNPAIPQTALLDCVCLDDTVRFVGLAIGEAGINCKLTHCVRETTAHRAVWNRDKKTEHFVTITLECKVEET